MTRVALAARVDEDFERIRAHLETHGVEDADERIRLIVSALDVLANNPRIGRRAAAGQRELVIGQGSRGYVARYRYLPARDLVLVLALRAQREGSYRG
jgi:toxin ParE1/3/4